MNIDYNFANNGNQQITFNDEELEYIQSKISQTNMNLSQSGNKMQKFGDQQSELRDGGDDPYYKTLIMIYEYFNHKVSLAAILNAIHQSAGDVRLALQRLVKNPYHIDETCDFSFQKLYSNKEKIEQYFNY